MQANRSAFEKLAWDDVRLFLAVCRERTLGQAGKSIGVDASTISRRLVVLEEALGASLFDRGRDGALPTAAAERLLPLAEEIEQAVARFSHQADGLEREVSGLVRITCPPDVAQVVVTPLLGELLARHPALRVALDPGETVLDLARREADLALRTVRPTSGDLVLTRLTSARWVLAAAPAVAKRLGTLRDFQVAPWVAWGERYGGIGAARWLDKHVKHADALVRSDSLALQIAAVAAGAGVALLPEPSLLHYGLVPVKLAPALREAAEAWPVDELYLVTHRALRDVPRVRAVWELILQRWSERPRR